MNSLYAKLLKGIITFFFVLWIIVVLLTRGEISHEIEEVFDSQLSQEAGILFDSIIHTIQSDQLVNKVLEKTDQGHKYESKISFQIWQDNLLLFRSYNAPIEKLSSITGYIDKQIAQQKWRVFSTRKELNSIVYTVITAEESYIRDELLNEILIRTITPLLLALPVLIFLLHFAIKKGLAPLQEIAKRVENRKASDFSPIDIEKIPNEIKTLITSLNHLMHRQSEDFEKEKRFTMNAAHELRTPIAAIQVQAQVAKKSIDQREKLLKSVDNILQGTTKSTHLINQLLTLARLDPETIKQNFSNTNILNTLQKTISELVVPALDKNIELVFDSIPDQGCDVPHYIEGINILISNLIQNAIRYTPENGNIQIKLNCQQEYYEIIIADSGPGILAEEIDKVMERYYRAKNQSHEGCGLGLSIVKQIVDIHQGQIKLKNNNGLTVQIIFPNKTNNKPGVM